MGRVSNKKDLKECLKCGNEKNVNHHFYKSNSANHKDGKFPICKDCLKENLKFADGSYQENIDSVKNVLLEMNRPFLFDVWESSMEEAKRTNKDIFGLYIKNINLNHRTKTWNDSEFELNKNNDSQQKIKKEKIHIDEKLIDKWGIGYSEDEYRAFVQKYNLLKNNYQEKTAMHTEALLTYIRYRVKEEMATAQNDMKAAKEWGQLAQKAAQDAKINPSQLSKSDLSDGLDTFGQLVRSVEQAVDIIPILPKFKERPQDKVDFTIWCYINYVRDLKGLPPAEYEEVYKFYEERKKEYADRLNFLKDDEE